MIWLFAASTLWAFSFGFIKHQLSGLDPWLVSAARLVVAAVVFLPWIIRRAPAASWRWRVLGLGAVQFGAMYVCYVASFRYLAAWQVALWTVFTPIMVALLAVARRGRAHTRPLLGALLAVGGAIVAEGRLPQGQTLQGVLLVQASNALFAIGQLGYRALAVRSGALGAGGRGGEAGLVGWMYLGGAVVTLAGLGLAEARAPAEWSGRTVAVLAYLGVAPTALGFWLWNKGAARTNPGRLAVANNLKVPLAVLVAWSVFGEPAASLRAVAGLVVLVVALGVVGGERDRGQVD
ncbi:MAG TPA: EamA family transporter [Candidatus Krumholzibacteria bacterium]|nr:EamA family transporter [Candidatus Krumholzibacteria bacterium]HPD72416.1 EamA family transporter [Candidatus Krumholzibacteria bacterium]HRY40652.1 EamA family transporter [Candidatus Krumholzibacteria bacterium]